MRSELGGYHTKAGKDAWAQAMAGMEFISEKRYQDALAISEQAISQYSQCKEAWVVRGGALTLIGKPERALECFDEVLRIDRDYDLALAQRETLLAHFPHLTGQ